MTISQAPPVPSGVLLQRIDLVPGTMVPQVRDHILSASVRSLPTLGHQLVHLRRELGLTIMTLALLFDRRHTTVGEIVKDTNGPLKPLLGDKSQHTERTGPNGSLLVPEEVSLLEWIETRQREFNCPTISDVCTHATEILHNFIRLHKT